MMARPIEMIASHSMSVLARPSLVSSVWTKKRSRNEANSVGQKYNSRRCIIDVVVFLDVWNQCTRSLSVEI